jgi:hypothetical protein
VTAAIVSKTYTNLNSIHIVKDIAAIHIASACVPICLQFAVHAYLTQIASVSTRPPKYDGTLVQYYHKYTGI